MNGITEIRDAEFREIAKLIYDQFGIMLTDKKKSLVQGRLNKVLRRKGYNSFKDYFSELQADTSGIMLVELIDRISTNHSYFFREPAHFEILNEAALDDIRNRFLGKSPESLRLWCAGCATGEEAYTLAMVLREHFGSLPNNPTHPIILATDISTQALETATRGEYDEDRLKMVPKLLFKKYFMKISPGQYRAKPELRNLILFRRLNFMSGQFPFKNKFHIIFCRNVMIYFDVETKTELIRKFYRHLAPKGYLFIGHSESITRSNPEFHFIAPAAYQRQE